MSLVHSDDLDTQPAAQSQPQNQPQQDAVNNRQQSQMTRNYSDNGSYHHDDDAVEETQDEMMQLVLLKKQAQREEEEEASKSFSLKRYFGRIASFLCGTTAMPVYACALILISTCFKTCLYNETLNLTNSNCCSYWYC